MFKDLLKVSFVLSFFIILGFEGCNAYEAHIQPNSQSNTTNTNIHQ